MARGVRHFVAAAAVRGGGGVRRALRLASIRLPHIHSDGYSYYVYLPSAFIYHDLTLETLAKEWYGGPYPRLHRPPPMAVHRPLAESPPDRHRDPDGAVLPRRRSA